MNISELMVMLTCVQNTDCVVGQLWCHMLSWLVNNNKKVTKDLNRHFTKDIQIASSTSLAIREIEIESTMRENYIPTRIKNQKH